MLDAGRGARSGQLAEKELNAARHQSIDFGLTGARRHEMAAGVALVERDAVHMICLPRTDAGAVSTTG
jgi:hypothetical protein